MLSDKASGDLRDGLMAIGDGISYLGFWIGVGFALESIIHLLKGG